MPGAGNSSNFLTHRQDIAIREKQLGKKHDDSIESDADEFEVSYDEKIFGEYKPGDADSPSRKIERCSIRMAIKSWEKMIEGLEPEEKAIRINEWKLKYPDSKEIFEKMQKDLKKQSTRLII